MLSDDLSGNLYQFDREKIFDPGAPNLRPGSQNFVQDGDANGELARHHHFRNAILGEKLAMAAQSLCRVVNRFFIRSSRIAV
jgi:hypothetical protein